MKNKQINKFLLMFFLCFTLFFSVSYAGIYETNNYYNVIASGFDSYPTNTYVDIYSELNAEFPSYHYTLFRYFENITTDSIDEFLTQFLEYLEDQYNLDSYVTARCGQYRVIHFYNSSEVEYALKLNSDNTANLMANISTDSKILTLSNVYMNSNPSPGPQAYFRTFSVNGLWQLDGTYVKINLSSFPVVSNTSLKEITYTSSLGYIWDEQSYYYKVETVPDVPSVNYDLAGIIDVIKNSTEVQDNIYPYLEEYFIIPNGNAGNEQVFSVYFYYPSVNLSQFEYSYNDILYYDLDKISIDGVISNLTYYLGGNTSSNVVKDVQLATLYYNPDTGTGDVYFTGNRTLDQLKSFESKTQPIIYTTKDIAYYSATWGETDTEWTAVPDTTKNIVAAEITDSEGNIVDPVLPGSSSVVLGDTPFERLVNVIQTAFLGLVDSISKGLISFTDYLLQIFGENVVTFVFLIVIKAITVLVSSVALVFRFVSFILTLVAIPATSTLLTVDVAANTSGLVFTGLNWGTHFINGLNFIKTIQWNGLGLWTLFEVFVSSLEVVLLVKIVRKHYRTL